MQQLLKVNEENMQLAEALILRAELQKRQSHLKSRVRRNLVIQEGDKPVEDPEKLINQRILEGQELTRLKIAINHTNEVNSIETKQGRKTITQALAYRDHLQSWSSFLRNIAIKASPRSAYHSRNEVRWVPLVEPSELQNEADNVARDLRQLMVSLQRKNWEITVENYTPNEAIINREL